MNKHTELPWAVGGTYKREVRGAAFEPVADAWPISGITIDGAIDNAAFIVKACNNHYKQKELNAQLLSMLENALEWIDAVPSNAALPAMPGFDRDEVDGLIEAIKQAEADDE